MVCDSQFTPAEYKLKIGWGHSTYMDAVELAVRGCVKQIIISHHDPNNSDRDIDIIIEKVRKILRERKVSIKCKGARDGMRISL